MSAEVIVSLINSTAFPIAACIFMGWFITNTLDKLRGCIDANTKVLSKLLGKLDQEDLIDGEDME